MVRQARNDKRDDLVTLSLKRDDLVTLSLSKGGTIAG
jgi:hypothetical protein